MDRVDLPKKSAPLARSHVVEVIADPCERSAPSASACPAAIIKPRNESHVPKTDQSRPKARIRMKLGFLRPFSTGRKSVSCPLSSLTATVKDVPIATILNRERRAIF